MKLGFLRYDEEFITDEIKITKLPNILDICSEVFYSGQLSEGWIYPPLIPAPLNHDERKNYLTISPQIPSQIFTLPSTHEIDIIGADDELLKYMINVYGFSLGMRLIPEGWSHFYRTPYERYKLTDFICNQKDQHNLGH